MNQRNRLFLLVGLVFASVATYLIGNGSVGLWDRDEPRYAETSRQMLQSGDWVVPHYLDKPRTAKPALIYWCQATAMKIFGDNEFAARFPSAVATVVLLVVLSCTLWRPIGPRLTVWTVFIFATSGLTIAAAKMSITDAVLLLWVTVGQMCLYAMLQGNRSWTLVVVLAFMIGLAGLTKGPVILGIQGATLLCLGLFKVFDAWKKQRHGFPVIVLQNDTVLKNASEDDPGALSVLPPNIQTDSFKTGSLKVLVGFLIVTALVLPWVLMVNHRASGFIQTGLKHDVWDRMMTPLEQHVGPPGYYFLTVWLTFFPWSLLLPLTIGVAIHRRAEAKTRFALAAIFGPWIMLECVRTKLPHYLLAIFPPLAYLTADTLVRCIDGELQNLRSKGFLVPVGIWAAVVAAAACAPWLMIRGPFQMPVAALVVLSAFGIFFSIAVFTAFVKHRITTAAVVMGLGTLIFISILYGMYFPNAKFLQLSERVARVLKDHQVTHSGQVIMLEYMEPSLAFAQGGTIREANQIGFSKKFEPLMPPWLVMNKTVWDKAPQELRDDFKVIDREVGLAYADHMKQVTVLIVHKRS